MSIDEQRAREFCAERVDDRAIAALERMAVLLRDENQHQNLVSAASLDHVWQRHYADSLQLLDHVPRGTEHWLDLGSGAGFPGLVLAVARPEEHFVLVESRKRRAEWLTRAAAALRLNNCNIAALRLEVLPDFAADVITARAFAPLPRLLALASRFSTPDSVWLLPKGRSAAQELAEQPADVRSMFHVEPSWTDPSGGILIGKGAPAVR